MDPTQVQVVIDMPGKFESDFSGSSVGQGQIDGGYEGAPLLYASYLNSKEIKRGRGYSQRVTIEGTREEVTEALYCLYDYADTYAVVNSDDPEYASNKYAALTMRARCRKVATEAGLDTSDWRGYA